MAFFMVDPLCLEKRLTDLGHLAGVFWKMNRVSRHFRWTWKYLLPVVKFEMLGNEMQKIHMAR